MVSQWDFSTLSDMALDVARMSNNKTNMVTGQKWAIMCHLWTLYSVNLTWKWTHADDTFDYFFLFIK